METVQAPVAVLSTKQLESGESSEPKKAEIRDDEHPLLWMQLRYLENSGPAPKTSRCCSNRRSWSQANRVLVVWWPGVSILEPSLAK